MAIGQARSASDGPSGADGGYDGDVLFENLELVRTITAAGGAEAVPLGLYVRRMPPTTSHYWSQRVRQAYDEFARPVRLVVWLSVAPAALLLGLAGAWAWSVPALLPSSWRRKRDAEKRRDAVCFPSRHLSRPPCGSLSAPSVRGSRLVAVWYGAAFAIGDEPSPRQRLRYTCFDPVSRTGRKFGVHSSISKSIGLNR